MIRYFLMAIILEVQMTDSIPRAAAGPPLPLNSVCKLRHLIYRQHWIREGDLMTIGSQLKLCQSLETLCLPIEEEKHRYWPNDLELPILKRLMLVSRYPLRTFPVLRKLLPGCPSSCDVYVALNETLDKAYDKDYRREGEDDSNEDGSDKGGSDKEASEENDEDEDASENEGRFCTCFPFEEEAAYFQRYRGTFLPKLDGSGFSLEELRCNNYSFHKLNREKAKEDHHLA
jgi:hypothetical protein